MRVRIADALRQLEGRGVVKRFRYAQAQHIIPYVEALVGRPLPDDLIDFYQEEIASIEDCTAISPAWNDRMGWRTPDTLVTELLHVNAIPLFYDGCGNQFALDLTPRVETPAVYFFDHEGDGEAPVWAAGSSLGTFLLLAADHDRALDEKWPRKWELKIDPDIDKCPRAPAIWNVRWKI